MNIWLHLGFNTFGDSFTSISLHFMIGVGPAICSKDECEHCKEGYDFHGKKYKPILSPHIYIIPSLPTVQPIVNLNIMLNLAFLDT
jgi:hypothetical protein